MIPSCVMPLLLNNLSNEVLHVVRHSDSHKKADDFYATFNDILRDAEDDLSFIFDMIERDPECFHDDTKNRLKALLDYVNITLAIYDPDKLHS